MPIFTKIDQPSAYMPAAAESERLGHHPPDPSDPREFPDLSEGTGRDGPGQQRHAQDISSNPTTAKSPPPLPPRNKRSPPSLNTSSVVRGNKSGVKGKGVSQIVRPSSPLKAPQLVFHCSLAHGSPTGLISGFSSIKELYMKIGQCFEIPSDEILFCTLNTFKLDMSKLLGGQLGLDDFIYVHLKGQRKEVEVVKSEPALGLTITDNGAGKAFIKRIKQGSLVESLSPAVKVGDHFEKLNGESVVGNRHFDVARALREIPIGSPFTLRLIEPMEAGFSHIAPRGNRSGGRKGSMDSYGTGKQTVRFKAKGEAVVEQAPDDLILDRMEFVLETYLGVSDRELALTVWELGKDLANPIQFTETIENSDLAEFKIPENVIFDMWGVISDWKKGQLKPVQSWDDVRPPLGVFAQKGK